MALQQQANVPDKDWVSDNRAPHCPICGALITYSVSEMIEQKIIHYDFHANLEARIKSIKRDTK